MLNYTKEQSAERETDFGRKLPRVVRLNEKFSLFLVLKSPWTTISYDGAIALTFMRLSLLLFFIIIVIKIFD